MSETLTAKTLTEAVATGKPRISCGDGLYLHDGTRFVLRFTRPKGSPNAGKVTEKAIGPYPTMTLAKARDAVKKLRGQLAEGTDPNAPAVKTKATFLDAAQAYISMNPEWSRSHRSQVELCLLRHMKPLHALDVNAIDGERLAVEVRPLWDRKLPQAKRVLIYVRSAFDLAITKGWRTTANPVTKMFVGHHVPKKTMVVKNYAAAPWQEVPGIVAKLATYEERGIVLASCLHLLILCSFRPNEAAGLRFADVQGDAIVIPAARMKAGRPHRVPLTAAAKAIIERRRAANPDSPFVFPSPTRHGEPVSPHSLAQFQRLEFRDTKYTTHGFRSSFRDWAAEHEMPFEQAEAALAHKGPGDATSHAYKRTDYIQQRLVWAQRWADLCEGVTPVSNVLPFKATA